MEERELINKRKSMMEIYKNMLSGQDIYDLNILSSVLVEKEKLAFMWTKIKVLKAWLNFHIPLTSAMLTMVLIAIWGVSFIPLRPLQRYMHPIAGATISLCGLAILLGL